MNHTFLRVCALAALTLGSAFAAEDTSTTTQQQEQAAIPSGDTTIITVNGKDIPLDLFRRFYADRLNQMGEKNTPAMQNRLFNDFVQILVTAQDAEKSGLDKNPEFELALRLQRLELLSNFAVQNEIQTHPASDAELKKVYDKLYAKTKGLEYKARHVLLETEEEAKKVIKEIEGGADFAELAKTRSLGPTGKDGGALPWFGQGQMVQPFTDATVALKAGEHTRKPVQTQFGWHVILLEETRERQPPALEDVKGELNIAYQQELLGAYLARLRETNDLELNTDLIKTSEDAEKKADDGK